MECIQQYRQSKIQPAHLSWVLTSGQMWLRCQDGWTCGGLSFLLRVLHSEMHSKNRPIAQSKYCRLNFESPNKNQSLTKWTVSILEFNSIVLKGISLLKNGLWHHSLMLPFIPWVLKAVFVWTGSQQLCQPPGGRAFLSSQSDAIAGSGLA